MSSGWFSPVGRLLSRIGLGVLTPFVSPELVDEVLVATDRGEQRFRALPSRLGVYFVLALCLSRAKSSTGVVRAMIPVEGLIRLAGAGWRPPSSTGLTKLRDRIGVTPFQLLFGSLARPAPTLVRSWSHTFGLRVVAWDGTEVEVADTDANREWFRPHRGKSGDAVGMPKIRLLVLLACGSRQLIGAVTGTLGQGEQTLAHRLVSRLQVGMLLLADRNFLGYRLWTAARARGTHLLWRAKQNTPRLPVQQVLEGGRSWLSTLYDPDDARAWRRNVARNRKRGHRPPKPRPITGVVVRVVEALITVTVDGVTRTEKYRLVTSLLDPALAPADQLIALYARRWIAETGIREIKTVLQAGRPPRGQTPVRALQELWATLVLYQAIRLLISLAALSKPAPDLDPSRISFTTARNATEHAITTTPADASRHLAWLANDLCQQLVTIHTSYRIFPRALKNTLSRYRYRGKTRQLTSGKASYRITVTPVTKPPDPAATAAISTNPAQPRAA
jgi:hypothetical protein